MRQREDSSIIKMYELERRFGDFAAVDRISLEVQRGEIFGLVGPDGAGKTTTLRILCGLLDPSAGTVSVAGLDVPQSGDRLRDLIGYMPQRFGLYSDLTVSENMQFYNDLFGLTEEQSAHLLTRLLQMTRMEPFQSRRAGHLSGGMKQKLALMCALLHQPEVLFLDEPTNGVDPISRRDFWAILYQLVQKGMTVVVTTSYLDEAERCNRVGLMYRGRLIACDSPNALVENLAEECFEIDCENRLAVRRSLSREPGVVAVETSGEHLHLCMSPKETSVEALQQKLGREGLSWSGFRRIRPALEDVFIAMVAAENREGH